MTRESRNILAHVAPFATWIALQTVLPATAGAYAVRSGATLAVLLFFLFMEKGRIYRTSDSSVPSPVSVSSTFLPCVPGLIGGLLVLALWVLPEACTFYRTWCVWPIGSLPAATDGASPYDPSVCGWTLTIAKLVGSAFVIAPVEEIFFRSFLYRWLRKRDFKAISLSTVDVPAFAWTVLLFTLKHDRPLAAALCAVIYGLLALRHGLLAAIVAHVTTNLLLAVYVIVRGEWAFW